MKKSTKELLFVKFQNFELEFKHDFSFIGLASIKLFNHQFKRNFRNRIYILFFLVVRSLEYNNKLFMLYLQIIGDIFVSMQNFIFPNRIKIFGWNL